MELVYLRYRVRRDVAAKSKFSSELGSRAARCVAAKTNRRRTALHPAAGALSMSAAMGETLKSPSGTCNYSCERPARGERNVVTGNCVLLSSCGFAVYWSRGALRLGIAG